MLLPVVFRKDESVLCYNRVDKELPIKAKGKFQDEFLYKFVIKGAIAKELINDDLRMKKIIPPNNINLFEDETDYFIALGLSKDPGTGRAIAYKYVVQNSVGKIMYTFDVEFINHYILLKP